MDLEIKDERLKETVRFHGHLCPGVLIGYRAAVLGMDRLGGSRAEDEELVAIVENDSCSVDAVQVITGCTFGKGNLVFRDWGKQVFTLAWRPEGRAVRLCFIGEHMRPIGADGIVDREAFTQTLLTAPDEKLFKVEEFTLEMPDRARIFPTAPCDECGEGTMAPRLFRIGDKKVCPGCVHKVDREKAMERVADFLFEVGMLKKTPRTGYQFLGNGRENVAEHSFRVAVIAYTLSRMNPSADADKAMRMALFHDLAEARTSDHNYVAKQYVQIDEERAIRDSTANAPNGPEIEALLSEFNRSETLEAQIAYDSDQLDMIFELKEKKDLGNKYAEAWLYYAKKRLITEEGRALYDAAMKTDWTHWWFDKDEHLWVLNNND